MDVRLRAFADRAPLAAALAWLDAIPCDGPQTIAAAAALGRILAAPVAATADMPEADTALINGIAIRAEHAEGASPYNPLPLPGGRPVSSGDPMPSGTDAVLGFEAIDQHKQAIAPVARGEGVLRRGAQLAIGAAALGSGRRLRPEDIALLLALGIETVSVRRRPIINLVIAGPRHGPDLLSPLLAGLLAEHGANAAPAPDLAAAIAAPADLLIFAGRSGTGPDDDAPERLAAAGGRLDIHGIAIRPGGSSGLGRIAGRPVLLLPGEPLACFAAFTLLAAPLLRRLAGHPPPPPSTATLTRKLVSGIGDAEFCRVRLAGAHAEPLGGLETAGLPGAVRADGYVLVPETSEGHPQGAAVAVHPFGAALP